MATADSTPVLPGGSVPLPSAGFAGATNPGGRLRKGGEAPLRVKMTRPVELIPSRRQALWGWPAVLNFVLGGLGAGLYVTAVVAAGFGRSPAVTVASWLGPTL